MEATAQASPYTIRNRPGWIYHNNDRTVAGNDLQVRLKTGYIGPANDPATLWSTHGAVYFTTDGSAPGGALGVPSGSSQAAALSFDGIQGDSSSNGNAAFWKGTMAGVLNGLPLGGQVKYRIGLWNTANNEEKFADHVASTDNQTFVYQNGVVGQPVLTVNGLNANYTTTKLFVDEIAGDSIPLSIVFAPGEANVTQAEIYTNLNRRDKADDDANGDGYDDGISAIAGNDLVAGDDAHYYKAYAMTGAGAGSHTLSLSAQKTGAYRLTARWKVSGDPNWRWYTNNGANRRDHAITVSPKDARDMVLYEINVLNIEATGDTFAQRSTIEDMHNAPGAPHNENNRWDLDYLKGLGASWLWFQPVHPPARDGREPFGGYGSGNPPYEPGSPYAVKNFFEISPIMTKNFSGDPFNNSDLLSQANRDAAMTAWQNFVAAADTKGVGLMLDAPFNHSAFDVELGQPGLDLMKPDGQTWAKTDEIRSREARFFSSTGNYGNRASSAANIAPGPDRFDFGKWQDVKDIFFGRYDALVEYDSDPERSSHTSEGDWFDATDADWTATDILLGGQSKNVTRQVWKYFARYATCWLEKTRPSGQNRNSSTETGLSTAQRYAWDARGIDGLRCDFGQGLPPQAWEYMINTAREKKWNFVMMSESLDGGAVTYRSNRHFDILNENIVFPLKSATTKSDYRGIFESRRDVYGQALVLINNVSHDEENYDDPWEALIRFSVAATMDGVPMIFPGQELGISKTSGYNHYELNFGKQVPHFKRFNSMQPIWSDANFGKDQLYPVYAGMGAARSSSKALRSSKRWFLDGDGGSVKIHGAAKYETSGASPAFQDVVLAFASLDRNAVQADNFKIPGALATHLGMADARTYNVKNIAAYENASIGMTNRRAAWLWGGGYTGAQLKTAGFFLSVNKVPTMDTSANPADPAWNQRPFEAQYLKLFDVTPPPASAPNASYYMIGTSGAFTWSSNAGPHDNITGWRISVGTTPGGNNIASNVEVPGAGTSYNFAGSAGAVYYATLRAVSAAGIESASGSSDSGAPNPASATTPVKLLAPAGDEDGDGQSNEQEHLAGMNPLSAISRFSITRGSRLSGTQFEVEWASVPGKVYRLQASPDLVTPFADITGNISASTGATTSHTDTSATGSWKFYRVRLVTP